MEEVALQLRLPDLEVGYEELRERGESAIEVLRGDGVDRVDDVGGELERGEAEVDGRGHDAVERLEGARGFLAAEALLEVEEVEGVDGDARVVDGGRVVRTRAMTSMTCTWTEADLNSASGSDVSSAMSLEKRKRTTRFGQRNTTGMSGRTSDRMSVSYACRERAFV